MKFPTCTNTYMYTNKVRCVHVLERAHKSDLAGNTRFLQQPTLLMISGHGAEKHMHKNSHEIWKCPKLWRPEKNTQDVQLGITIF